MHAHLSNTAVHASDRLLIRQQADRVKHTPDRTTHPCCWCHCQWLLGYLQYTVSTAECAVINHPVIVEGGMARSSLCPLPGFQGVSDPVSRCNASISGKALTKKAPKASYCDRRTYSLAQHRSFRYSISNTRASKTALIIIQHGQEDRRQRD